MSYKNVKLTLCLTTSALNHENVWENVCIDSDFLDFGTSSRCELYELADLLLKKDPTVEEATTAIQNQRQCFVNGKKEKKNVQKNLAKNAQICN
jgi:hypothetical protein